jgi:hypothetical protein
MEQVGIDDLATGSYRSSNRHILYSETKFIQRKGRAILMPYKLKRNCYFPAG